MWRTSWLLTALNIAVFYAAWFGCVLAAASGRSFLALAAPLTAVGVHLALSNERRPEIRLVCAGAVAGLFAESLLVALGRVSHPSLPAGLLPPFYAVALWMAFATTLNASLGGLRGRPWLAAALGAAGGPLAYIAAERLGAIGLGVPLWMSLSLIGFVYAVALPVLCKAAVSFTQTGTKLSTGYS